MNTTILKLPAIQKEKIREIEWGRSILPEILLLILLLIWFFIPIWLNHLDPAAGEIDQSHWFLVLLGLITFLIILALCRWLLQHLWKEAGLPELKNIISNFNQLTSWQQLNFLLASFSLLLLAAIGSLAAIC